jgi:drug/metabolite transporter (DMT)-like permease
MIKNKTGIRIEYFLMLIVTFSWAIGFPLTRIIVKSVHPFQIATLALGIAFLSLFIFLIASRKIKHIVRLPSRVILISLGLGVLGFFLYHTLSFSALARIPASMNAILVSTNVVFIVLFAALILKERIMPASIIGIALALCGVVLVTFNRGFTLEGGADSIDLLGCLFSILAAILFALYSVLGKKVLVSSDPLIITAISLFSGAALLAILTASTVGFSEVAQADLKTLLILIFIGLSNGIAYPLWFTCLKRLPAAHVSIYIYLMPVFAIILSLVIINERFSWLFWVGGALILGGIIITNRFASVRTNKHR